MRTRLSVVALVSAAVLLDGAGSSKLAYVALVSAVPVSAGAALLALGEVLAAGSPSAVERLRTILAALVAGLVLVAAAARAPLVTSGDVPELAAMALLGCFAVLALDALLAGAGLLRLDVRLETE